MFSTLSVVDFGLIYCTPPSPKRSAKGLGNLKITSEGFQFLLEDVNTQLWDLLLEYLRSSSVRGTLSHS
jgi:hypothetical protein